MGNWSDHIRFTDLVNELVSRTSGYRVAKYTGRDKTAVRGWQNGGKPQNPSDVGLVVRCAIEEKIDLTHFQTFRPIWNLAALASHEEWATSSPPHLEWLTSVSPPPFKKYSLKGLDSDSCVGISAGPLTSTAAWTCCSLDLGYGISTFRTRRSRQKAAWDPPLIAFAKGAPLSSQYDPAAPPEVVVAGSPDLTAGSIPNVVNSIGVASEPPEVWAREYELVHQHPRGGQVGIGLLAEGATQAEYQEDALKLVDIAISLRAPFIEFSWYCPNLERHDTVSSDLSFMESLFKEAASRAHKAGILFAVKLPPLPEDLLRDAVMAAAKHVDIFSIRNTLIVKPVRINREGLRYAAFPGRLFGGLSGPATFSVTLRVLQVMIDLRTSGGYNFDIIAGGGVSRSDDVAELLNNGANLVQVCTAAMFDPLMAWKTNGHIKLGRKPLPRNRAEQEAFENLDAAVGEFAIRGFSISHTLVDDVWSNWMSGRTVGSIGLARRPSIPRTKNQWITIINNKLPR